MNPQSLALKGILDCRHCRKGAAQPRRRHLTRSGVVATVCYGPKSIAPNIWMGRGGQARPRIATRRLETSVTWLSRPAPTATYHHWNPPVQTIKALLMFHSALPRLRMTAATTTANGATRYHHQKPEARIGEGLFLGGGPGHVAVIAQKAVLVKKERLFYGIHQRGRMTAATMAIFLEKGVFRFLIYQPRATDHLAGFLKLIIIFATNLQAPRKT